MKFWPALLGVILLVTEPVAAAPATLGDVQRAFAATTSMTADFQQTAANGAVARGTMQMKRPGRIRFDYGKNSPILVVADGNRLSFVDYKVSQVSQWPLGATPLGVLLNSKAELGRIARIVPDAENPRPDMVAVYAEDPKRPDIGSILFFLKKDAAAPGGMRLEGWRVTDAQNNLTTVELSNIRSNTPISDSVFSFKDPRPKNRVPGKTG